VIGFVSIGFLVLVGIAMLYFIASDIWKKTKKQRYYISNFFWYSVILIVFFSFVIGILFDLPGDSPIFWSAVLSLSLSIAGWVVYKQIKREN
jgi:hypothetical protein